MTRSENSKTTVNFKENQKNALITSKRITMNRAADFYTQSFIQMNESLFRKERI